MNLLKIQNKDPETIKFYYTIARNTAFITAVFAFVVSILIIVNFIRVKTVDPLDMPQMKKLITETQEDTKNADLKDTVRELDLLARKAYFSSLVFTARGAYLLLGSIILFLLCLSPLRAG